MIHYSDPPILLRNVLDDVDAARALLARAAPYTPLGGWYRPDADPDAATSPLWFQNDWVHADLRVPGSELFLHHPRVIRAARDFYGAEVIVPHSVYVNVMVALDRAGPAHTDNPRFQGRDRTNTPMWLLRTMLWSNLFDRFAIVQATSIWWMNDVEGGEFRYWPKGPDAPPERHVGDMANTALVGDNHGMFHQVGAVGPFGSDLRVSPRAELAPAATAAKTGPRSRYDARRWPRPGSTCASSPASVGRRRSGISRRSARSSPAPSRRTG
ncbi:MAG TPA: hypothetical protein VNE71_12355 [Myxococcota bacterium]|nr:hypothetical protein [Myxococcota bacterium]